MKKKIYTISIAIITIMILPIAGMAQTGVGINIDTPQADLDINGNLRIQNVPTDNKNADVLIIGNEKEVKLNQNIIQRSFFSASSSSQNFIDVTLFQQPIKYAAGDITIDENNDYNSTTGEFIAPVDGIYEVYAHAQYQSFVAGQEAVGIILERRLAGQTTKTEIARETIANITLLSIQLSTPERFLRTLIILHKGDAISYSSVGLSGTLIGKSTFDLEITQVK